MRSGVGRVADPLISSPKDSEERTGQLTAASLGGSQVNILRRQAESIRFHSIYYVRGFRIVARFLPNCEPTATAIASWRVAVNAAGLHYSNRDDVPI